MDFNLKFWNTLTPGKRAIAANQAITMAAQSEPGKGSAEPKETSQQDARRTRSTRRTAAAGANVESADMAHNSMMLGHDGNEDKEAHASSSSSSSQQTKSSSRVPHRYGHVVSQQRKESARKPERPGQVGRSPIGDYYYPSSSRAQDQFTSSSAAGPPTSRSEQPSGQGPTSVSNNNTSPIHRFQQHRQGSSNYAQEEREGCSRLHELPDKIDGLSVDMRNVQRALENLQQEKHQKLALQRDLKEAQDKLAETTADLEAARKRWKKAASQLSQFQSQGGAGLYQVTDGDLINSAKQLRYDIRAFSVQYFLGKAPLGQLPGVDGGFSRYMRETINTTLKGYDDDDVAHLMSSETSGPVVIQAFLWRLLVGEIFEQFRWAASPPWLRKPMAAVYRALKPTAAPTPEASGERRFQMWKATTSALILESMESMEEEEEEEEQEQVQRSSESTAEKTSSFNCWSFSDRVLDIIRPFVRNDSDVEGILGNLCNIIESSIALDQEICRQMARVDWVFPPPPSSKDLLVSFNPDDMAVGVGETTPRPGQYVSVVMAPALKKRGKSTGEDFEIENLLLKMEVTCM